MNKKKFVTFIIVGVMLLSSSINVTAVEDNAANTLDIEKTAIEAINNAQSVKDFEEMRKSVNKHYSDAEASKNRIIGVSKIAPVGDALVQAVILNPISAQNAVDQYETNKEVNNKTVILDAYSKYIALLKSNYAVTIQKGLADTLEKDNETARLQLINGLISEKAARLVDINYLKAKYTLSKFENSLDSAYMTVNLATGEDVSKRYITLMDNNILVSKIPMSAEEYVKNALANRGEIVNAQNSLDAKKKVLANTPASWIKDYNLYVKQSNYDIDNSEYNLDEAKINIQLEIEKGYKDFEGNIKNLESQQANYDLAEANYQAAKIQLDNSMITLDQFDSVEVAKAQAQMNLKNAELDAWLEARKMDFASGIGPAIK